MISERIGQNHNIFKAIIGWNWSYSLGANNIGNVMGVFVPSSPFENLKIAGIFDISAVEQLFLLGAIAIAIGVFTYSKRVMMTVGGSLMTLSPVGALVVRARDDWLNNFGKAEMMYEKCKM